ncbi:MAG: hypothetical protein LBL34_05005 [Clostridiales bacterium]|jgi:hypothetical protein|nr:hypothetical protein [Clostridiales bacterium]
MLIDKPKISAVSITPNPCNVIQLLTVSVAVTEVQIDFINVFSNEAISGEENS